MEDAVEFDAVVAAPPRSTFVEAAAGPAGAAGADRVGHGLTGMRERVEMLGGTIIVGLRSDGGFRVEVTLPTTITEPAKSDVDATEQGKA